MANVIELLMMPLAVSFPMDVPWIYRHVHLCPHRRGPFCDRSKHTYHRWMQMWRCRNCATECCVYVNVVPDNMNFTWKFFSHRMQPKLKFTTTYG